MITLDCLRALYGYNIYTLNASDKNSIALGMHFFSLRAL